MDHTLQNKKVLLMGLGVLGGGVNTARWLIKQGADLTITDLNSAERLATSLEALAPQAGQFKLALGGHNEQDFLDNEIVVVNPDVPKSSRFLTLAREHGKAIENELTLFYRYAKPKKIIAITGTRGKTTTVNWAAQLLANNGFAVLVAGNSPDNPLLAAIEKVTPDTIVVLETPSFLLEWVEAGGFRPDVAVITNLYRDHLNRYRDIEDYATTKGNIFKNQTPSNWLVLNQNDHWLDFWKKLKPKSQLYLFSAQAKKFPVDYVRFVDKWGEHNLDNLLAALSAVTLAGLGEVEALSAINKLTNVKFREELIYDSPRLAVYNDTSATSPEGTMVAVERFKNYPNLILIAGGTDRELEYADWADTIRASLPKENLVLLAGSATNKMLGVLDWPEATVCDTLEQCLKTTLEKSSEQTGKTTILFSPGAKSFEKFRNEFDRGEQFNALVKKYIP